MISIFGVKASPEGYKKEAAPKSKAAKGTSFAAAVSENENSAKPSGKPSVSEVSTEKCPNCDGLHLLYKCDLFKKMVPAKRLGFVSERRLCFNCLRPGGHAAKHCKLDRRCNVEGCKIKHSPWLHYAFTDSSGSKSAANVSAKTPSIDESSTVSAHACMSAKSSGTVVALPIVPVSVNCPNGNVVETHALLDTGSNRSFCPKSY